MINNNFQKKPIGKRKLETIKFQESLDPNMDPTERFFLCLENLYRRDEDTLKALDIDRPDGDVRRIAFYESFFDAIKTDQQDWSSKMIDVINALSANNAEQLLVALCGWCSNTLAKRAGILPDDGLEFVDYNEDTYKKIIVNWDNGEKTSSECDIEWNLQVINFDFDIFTKYADTAKIESVNVEVTPYFSKECNCFNCVSKEERDQTNDEFTYWYCLDDNSENS